MILHTRDVHKDLQDVHKKNKLIGDRLLSGAYVRRLFQVWLGLIACMACLFTSSIALALGLGDIHVRSRIGEPLYAEVDLYYQSPKELVDASFRIASPNYYRLVQMEYHWVLKEIVIQTRSMGDGRLRLQLTTKQKINEPSLAIAIDFVTPHVQIQRAYQVLFDPPEELIRRSSVPPLPVAVSPPPPPVPSPLPSPKSPSVATEDVEGKTSSSAPLPKSAGSPSNKNLSPTPPTSYIVKEGNTLLGIASTLMPSGSSPESTRKYAKEIFNANPGAFMQGDPNRLHWGRKLILPNTSGKTLDPVPTPTLPTQIGNQEGVPNLEAPVNSAESTPSVSSEAPPRLASPRTEPTLLPPPVSDQLRLSKASASEESLPSALAEESPEQFRGLQEQLFARDRNIKDQQQRIAEMERNISDLMRQIRDMRAAGCLR